jgi:hypothetical protein
VEEKLMATYRVLLVEDHQVWIDILKRKIELALKSYNHENIHLRIVSQFEEAYEILKEECWSLLVTDIGLGDNPHESLKKQGRLLIDLAREFQVPTIAVSGTINLTTGDVGDLYEKHRVSCFFEKKNFDEERFIAKVQALLIEQRKICPSPIKLNTSKSMELNTSKEIFISYAWGGESEELVDKLDQAFQAQGIIIIRDKRDLNYKGRIKDFMKRIGQGKCIILVISEKYLRSENCMFELVQISKNGKFYDRIFPVVLDDAKIYKPIERIQYIQHWENQIKELEEAMRSVSAANMQGFREDIDLYTEIRSTIAELTNTLKDMNTLTTKLHKDSGFSDLFKAIEQKIAE